MSVQRFTSRVGVLAVPEVNNNAWLEPQVAADGCLPYIAEGDPPAPSAPDYVADGNLGMSAQHLVARRPTVPGGAFVEGEFRTLFRGRGSAYAAADTPPREVHRWLQAAGRVATFQASPAPRWLYTPRAPGQVYTTLSVRQILHQSQQDVRGVLASWSYEATAAAVPIHTFAWRGIMQALPATNTATTAITYEFDSVLPPLAIGAVHTIGSYSTAVIRSVRYTDGLSVETARPDMAATGGHAGFAPGAFAPRLTLVIERPPRATFDPEALYASRANVNVSVRFGTTANNQWVHAFAQGVIAERPVPSSDGPVALVELTIMPHPDTPSSTTHAFDTVTFD